MESEVLSYDEIKKKFTQLENEYTEIECAKNSEINERTKAIKEEIGAKYSDRLKEASNKKWEAHKELEDAEKRRANEMWYAPGTVVYEWTIKGYGQKEYIKSGKSGIVHVFDHGSPCADNLSSWSRPKVGDVIIYLHKKDGTAGKQFVQISRYGQLKSDAKYWLPDGEIFTLNPH